MIINTDKIKKIPIMKERKFISGRYYNDKIYKQNI